VAVPPPSQSTNWPIVWCAVGAGIVAAFQIGKAPAAIPVLRAELGIALVTAGWVISIFNVLGVAVGIFAGAVADALGHRRLVLAGLIVIAASSLAGGLAPGIETLLAARFFEGLGFIAIIVAAPGVFVRASRTEDVHVAFSYWGTYMPAGTALMLVAAAPVIDAAGWRGLWLVNAGLVLAYAGLFAVATRELAGRPPRETGPEPSIGRDVWVTMRSPGPIALALCFATYTGNFIAVMGFFPTYLIDEAGFAAAAANAVAAAAVATNILGNLAAGRLLKRGARRWALIAIACVTMGLAALALYALDLGPAARIALCFVFTTVGGLLPTSVLAATADYAPRRDLVATTNGLVMQGSNLGQMIGPPSVALLVGAYGGWHAAPIYITTAAAVGVGFALVIRRLRGRIE